MKVLWCTNIILPDAAKRLGIKPLPYGGWMVALAKDISRCDNIRLAIATVYDGNKILSFEENNIKYYLLPGGVKAKLRYEKKLEQRWAEVISDFSPDIIHIHGTEFAHSLALMKVCKEIPVVVSIQGLLTVYSRVYYGGMEIKDIILNRTLRDNLKLDGLIEQKYKFEKRAIYERELLRSVHHVIGRTTWDYANVKAINPNVKYHFCNESLRDEFYNVKWDISFIKRHTIFTTQAVYPIKGVHFLLEAVALLKRDYPDVRVYITGPNIIDRSSIKSRLRLTGYGKYLLKLIRHYNLESNVKFMGEVDAGEVASYLAKAHVFVLPSAIENSPNSLCEAQLVGTPCVASYVGGVPDMVKHGVNGLLYNYSEPAILAEMISRIFNSDDLALSLSTNAIKTASQRNNRQKNLLTMIQIYYEIGGKN